MSFHLLLLFLSAFFLHLQLYYPLNYSLCIELDSYVSHPPPILWAWSTTSWQCLFLASAPTPLFVFRHSPRCQETLLLSLLGDAARDYSPPTFDPLPRHMARVFFRLRVWPFVFTSTLDMLLVMLTPTPPVGLTFVSMLFLCTCKHMLNHYSIVFGLP